MAVSDDDSRTMRVEDFKLGDIVNMKGQQHVLLTVTGFGTVVGSKAPSAPLVHVPALVCSWFDADLHTQQIVLIPELVERALRE